MALQAPGDDLGPGLTDPFVGLVLALGAWGLLKAVRARRGVSERREPASWAWAVVMLCVSGPSSFLHSTSALRGLYLAMGVVVVGLVWYRVRRASGNDQS
ncbi:hypothetical protein [Streptomyces sp. ICBB 8177]|uniref:hypothetical protein n=1 Tax=Streptomyces sp. ICBB 8177 TaxID=563922 RepID=UPI000D682DCC|nr:hypothetical protein [Streptomyces sp. ICBB 8177]PWI45761.1 hypothetical protein CK485_00870 [Streptomyces sp. ICBB 8177]